MSNLDRPLPKVIIPRSARVGFWTGAAVAWAVLLVIWLVAG